MRKSLPKSRVLLSNVWASLFCAAESRLDQNTQTKIFAHTYFDWDEDWGTLEQDHDFCSQMFFLCCSAERLTKTPRLRNFSLTNVFCAAQQRVGPELRATQRPPAPTTHSLSSAHGTCLCYYPIAHLLLICYYSLTFSLTHSFLTHLLTNSFTLC